MIPILIHMNYHELRSLFMLHSCVSVYFLNHLIVYLMLYNIMYIIYIYIFLYV